MSGNPAWSQLPAARDAADHGDYGTVVRLARTARNLTLGQAGKLIGYSGATLSRIETGRQKLTDTGVMRRIAAALNIPPTMLGLADVNEHAVARRDVLSAGVSLAVAPTLPVWSGISGRTIGVEVVEHLASRVADLWHLDDVLGGGACLGAAAADWQLVSALLNRSRTAGPARTALLDVAAALARFAGWAAFDAGAHTDAREYWRNAIICAELAGDGGQVAYTLSNLALQAIYLGRGREAVSFIDAARTHAGDQSQTVIAMLDAWQARAYSVLGDRRQAIRLLNHADQAWEHRRPEDDPPWIYWMPRPTVTAESGTTFLALGEPDRAEQILMAGLARWADAGVYDRDQALYLMRLAESRIKQGEYDAAATATSRAISGLADVESARLTGILTRLLALFPSREPMTVELRRQAAQLAC